MRPNVVMTGAVITLMGITLGFVLKQDVGCPITVVGLLIFILGVRWPPRNTRIRNE